MSVGDVLASCLRYLLFAHKGYGFSGSCKVPYLSAKGFAPDVLVFGVFEEMTILKEVASFVIKDCIGIVTEELEGILV